MVKEVYASSVLILDGKGRSSSESALLMQGDDFQKAKNQFDEVHGDNFHDLKPQGSNDNTQDQKRKREDKGHDKKREIYGDRGGRKQDDRGNDDTRDRKRKRDDKGHDEGRETYRDRGDRYGRKRDCRGHGEGRERYGDRGDRHDQKQDDTTNCYFQIRLSVDICSNSLIREVRVHDDRRERYRDQDDGYGRKQDDTGHDEGRERYRDRGDGYGRKQDYTAHDEGREIYRDRGGLVKLSKGCPKLRKLKLRGCPFSEQVVTSYVFNIPSLRYVWFDSSDRDHIVLVLIRPRVSTLKHWYIRGFRINDAPSQFMNIPDNLGPNPAAERSVSTAATAAVTVKASRRIRHVAAMIRTKEEVGSGMFHVFLRSLSTELIVDMSKKTLFIRLMYKLNFGVTHGYLEYPCLGISYLVIVGATAGVAFSLATHAELISCSRSNIALYVVSLIENIFQLRPAKVRSHGYLHSCNRLLKKNGENEV
ncbi:hypothetical protein CTI12_AA015110 [Artemisia annua]|uniref:Uncharacterized protein n=1 Tax=Artemisia annua TaxID=35608 RepID=A0A2U1QL60_ARTAN|nr:hypothetical protein CTI12_AA015110 [Artemisia annua]